MAEVNRTHVRKGGEGMSLNALPSQVPRVRKAAPVRVKLERINCDFGKLLPAEDDHPAWI